MKTKLEPETSPIDPSRMSPEQRAALELTEAAREIPGGEGFSAGLFMGRWKPEALLPYPIQSSEDRDQGDAFLSRLAELLQSDAVDPDEIDATGEIPEAVLEALAKLGAFGIKIPTRYGGLGLSQTNYCRAAILLGGYCGNLTALISAHQSIGVPQPLLLFGSEEQKERFLPRIARGEISAFALTEPGVGSDPARMETMAEPTEDGSAFILNGEKLWCTNGSKAGVIVVMARTPSRIVNGRERPQISAFILEMDSPGVEVVRRCRFMGLHALYNAVIRFENVRVPRENLILAEGKGLRVALSTLNTGRLTLPAACAGLSKRCLEITRRWAAQRVQWGRPIGQHAAVADRIARIASETFAMEAMTFYTAAMVDRDRHADIRLEAALCKLWATERSWEALDATMQIRGGRGYETAASLAARGEEPIAVERFFRDARINTIFEGSSEIMRLFIAREALDPHLQVGAPVLDTRLPIGGRFRAALRAGRFYAAWYPRLWLPHAAGAWHPRLRPAMREVERYARKLARALFHAMALHGPALERRQLLLGRMVDIGSDLFAMSAACARAQAMGGLPAGSLSPIDLALHLCGTAGVRVRQRFTELWDNADRQGAAIAREVLDGKAQWIEEGKLPLAPPTNSPS